MKALSNSAASVEAGVRWTARLLASFLVGLVLLFFIGDRGFDPLKLTTVESVQMFLFFATCVGMVVAWRWELIGGAISTAGTMLFFAVELAVTGRFPRGVAFHLILLPGILFMLSGLLRKRTKSKVRKDGFVMG